MTSKLIFYQCEITPEKNCVVDDLTSYLNSLTSQVIDNFQYIKLDLDLYIKVNSSQVNVPKFNYNYVAIKNSDVDKVYYYFIIGSPTWISSSTIQLQLSLDTLNTFNNELTWTTKTNITRQHKDRFNKNVSTTGNFKRLKRIIDKYEEGFSATKYFESQKKITTSLDYDFYLIYKNKENLTADSTVPMDCFCCASKPIPLSISTSAQGIYFANYNKFDLICAFSKDNAEFTTTIKGVSYTIGGSSQYKGVAFSKNVTNSALLLKDNNSVLINNIGTSALTDTNSSIKLRTINYQLDPAPESTYSYTSLLGIVESKDYVESTVGTTSGVLNTIDSVNRTDTRIVKIIKMPYAPFYINLTNGKLKIPSGWTYSNGYLLLNDLNTEFITEAGDAISIKDLMTVYVLSTDIAKDKKNDIKYESKLYNSNFYSLKYLYDNFEKEIYLERYSTTLDNPAFDIAFKQSNNISSNSIFKFTAINGSYKVPDMYGEYLNVNRQNEVALYNSDYLNYIRTGYNYDKKAKTRQLVTGIVGTALGIAGAAASVLIPAAGIVGAAGAISLATSSLSSITSTVNTAIANEQAIQQKLDTAKMSAASVSNTDDLNLLSYYNGNRLLEERESISDEVKQGLYNLFRLTGYACNEYAIPVVNSRLYYNFIQCKADFEESKWTYAKSFLDDIKAKYGIGVTVFHKVDNSYDFLQTKENFETWMIES